MVNKVDYKVKTSILFETGGIYVIKRKITSKKTLLYRFIKKYPQDSIERIVDELF